MRRDKGELHIASLAKYAAAFFRMSRSARSFGDLSAKPVNFLLLGPHLAVARKGVPGIDCRIPYPTPQNTFGNVQVTGRLHHGHTALGHQLRRLELELSAEHSSLHGNLRSGWKTLSRCPPNQ